MKGPETRTLRLPAPSPTFWRAAASPRVLPIPRSPASKALPAIPALRGKEKEEKRGGALDWCAGSGSGSGGLVGGGTTVRVGSSLAMRSGFLGRAAAALSGMLGGPASPLGRLLASAAGRWIMGAFLLVWGALILAAAAKFLGREAVTDVPVLLDGPAPAMVAATAPASGSLDYVAAANRGEILWAGATKPAQPGEAKDALGKEPPQAPAAEEKKAEEPPPFKMPTVRELMGRGLDRDGFAKRFSGDTGRLQAGAFGAPAIKDAAGFALRKTFAGPGLPSPQRGRLGDLQRARRALGATRLGSMRGRTSRAMGQLKLADSLSALGAASASDQGAHALASGAFDQSKPIGGELAGLPGGTGVVVPPGSGAPGAAPGAPDLPPGANLTPYQGQLNNANGLGDMSAMLKKLGEMLLAIGGMLLAVGLALVAAGTALLAAPPPMNLIGAALIGAGGALAAVGGGLMSAGEQALQRSQDMANQAQNQGNGIAQQYGQTDQGNIVNQCAQQAAATGTPVEACAATNPAQNQQAHHGVQEAVAAEGNAGFALAPAEGR